jgi:sec-independent protein translocase protein TatA
MHFGWQEIIFIVLIALILFGAGRIPELMRNMGRGVKEFKKGLKEIDKPDDDDEKEDEEPKSGKQR